MSACNFYTDFLALFGYGLFCVIVFYMDEYNMLSA